MSELELLQRSFTSGPLRYRPEDSPFGTLFADITHRCNMACHNCYIPVRNLPDFPVDFLYDTISRLPRRTRIRLVGAEPTMRADLPEIISRIRQLGHHPVILTNGLKLGRRAYVEQLKAAGLRTSYISLNGGLDDELYEAIDGIACARRKLQALNNLLAARLHVTTGTILVRGLSESHLGEWITYLLDRGVRDIHFRSVGQVGRYLQGEPLTLEELESLVRDAAPPSAGAVNVVRSVGSTRDLKLGGAEIQLTEWPDLGSLERGRITPDGFVEPQFESMIENAGGY